MKEKALNLLGLMRKANAIQIGEENSGASIRAGTAKLLLLASDASDNAVRRAKGFVYGRNIPLISTPFMKEEISAAVGKPGCSMLAVCDLGFADSFMKLLQAISPDIYDETARIISDGLAREKQRRRENRAHEKNKRIGKRRNNA